MLALRYQSIPRFCLVIVLALSAVELRAASCEAMKEISLDHTKIETAESVAAGTFQPPYGNTIEKAPPFCRVAGTIAPSADSTIRFEVWLPASDWNGKFLGVGNGGFAGAISYDGMGGNLKRHYATASTDTGHAGGGQDATWAYKHPEKVIDFGHRAIHETALKAKALIAAYYGRPAQHAYFSSCSNGGREALMEAQRYPADYDGILAGAPANYWTHLLVGRLNSLQSLLGNPEAYVSTAKLPAIAKAVNEACDMTDGVKDRVNGDPERCHFNPQVLLCNGPESRDCLTAPQVRALAGLYAESNNRSGKPVFPGMVPGAELGQGGWGPWILGEGPGGSYGATFMVNFLRYMVYDDPAFNPLTAEQDAAVAKADEKVAKALNATDPDLRRFAERGGKLILYHGWNDPAISPLNTIDYYKSVRQSMGDAAASRFVRLYMLPGVQHCVGGPGPSVAGQGGSAPPEGEEHGLYGALENWVEQGREPGQIFAAKYTNDNQAAPLLMTRPVCAYPQALRYTGKGDPKDASSFTCESK